MAEQELLDLERLLEAARIGDEPAQEQFFSLICKFVLDRVKHHITNKEEAEDITQEVLLTVVKKFNNMPTDRFPAWLYETIRHKIGDYIRRQNREKRVFGPYSEVLLSVVDEVGSQPDAVFQAKELESLVQQLWAKLSPDKQQLLSLLLDGSPETEIRQQLGLCCGTFYARIHRLRKKLMSEFQNAGCPTS